ncbi:hypothetical protein, partial [Pseudomonas sp. LFS044]|uniref:hypothetical protein n=1 Tax=Pseudomonas sp. LFS044 TaxID=3229880 RepID=UPI003A807435
KNRVMPTRLATMASQAMARCNKCRSGLARDAPRGRRSIYATPQLARLAPQGEPRNPWAFLKVHEQIFMWP